LEEIYQRLSKAIIHRRAKKIHLLEKYDCILNDGDQVQMEIQKIEEFQLGVVAEEHRRQEQILMDLLTKREKMR
jgi:hypothetical protein